MLRLLALYQMFLIDPKYSIDVSLNHIENPSNYIDTTIFGGLSLWFGWSIYRMRKDEVIQKQFIKFTTFTMLAFFTFLLSEIEKTQLINNQYVTVKRYATHHIVSDTVYLIRALMFLSFFGIIWPRKKPKTRARTRTDDMISPSLYNDWSEEIEKDKISYNQQDMSDRFSKFDQLSKSDKSTARTSVKIISAQFSHFDAPSEFNEYMYR
ncbi:hypothetical protein BDF19DRAFT_462618 [Syncephalis fuscata]|nr:hypothetical protein BDF19DRAFT_462618 [Syncephalis fuscata]